MSDLERIEAAMEEKVRPALRSHGGDISIDHVEGKTVYVQYERRTSMELIIRNNSGQPIYDQISGQIKAQILSGALSPGDALPSIRGLAKDLKISVITTKRAYDELEAQGLINTVAGKGCFVAEPDLALFREQSLHLLEDHLAAAAELARTCGLSESELAELLRRKWEESL